MEWPMKLPEFGLNRFDWSSPRAFAADAKRAEDLGYGYAFIATNPLTQLDPYVMLAAVADATERIRMGPLLDNPVLSHPAVTANAIATVARVSEGRAVLGYGVGDTAVRFLGKRPAKMAELEGATVMMKRLLAGEAVEVGAARPARLRSATPVPIWLAAGGPKTMRMAGRIADGVFLRVGRHPANLRRSIEAIHEGAREAGRDPADVKLGLIFHTIMPDVAEDIRFISRSMAAGYYEYTPALFDTPGIPWDGPPVHDLQQQVWPDFHHARDLVEAGRAVEFLTDEAAASFALFGSAADIAGQIAAALAESPPIEIVVPHPVPMPVPGAPIPRQLNGSPPGADFKTWFASEVMPRL
jgi:5,10-methylenetetrahydromethanopterin reductase